VLWPVVSIGHRDRERVRTQIGSDQAGSSQYLLALTDTEVLFLPQTQGESHRADVASQPNWNYSLTEEPNEQEKFPHAAFLRIFAIPRRMMVFVKKERKFCANPRCIMALVLLALFMYMLMHLTAFERTFGPRVAELQNEVTLLQTSLDHPAAIDPALLQVYVYKQICIYTYTYIHMIHMIHIYLYAYIYIYTYILIHMYIYIHTNIYIHIYTYAYIHMYICKYMSMYVYTFIYICMYAHTPAVMQICLMTARFFMYTDIFV